MKFHVVRLDKTDSTMKEAAAYPPGTAVVAEEQTAGQGRLGRRWHSERGTGLYCSLVLPTGAGSEPTPILTLALGLAVQEAIQQVTGIAVDLRWPNDVLAGDRKCAGILVEFQQDKLVAGIGVNVNQTEFPEEIAPLATSLRIATGRECSKVELLERILERVSAYISLLAAEGKDTILRLFTQASSYVSGRRVVVDELEGTTDGMDPSGFLWLRRDDGGRELIMAGGLRPAAGSSGSG
jgi:BirA family biotin operon repressor/biotin-[acetyl-CoA-carboxylase] ligase